MNTSIKTSNKANYFITVDKIKQAHTVLSSVGNQNGQVMVTWHGLFPR